MASSAESKFNVVVRTWANGRLLDEQLLRRGVAFAAAAGAAQRFSKMRVRLNNQDVTVSVEPAQADDLSGVPR